MSKLLKQLKKRRKDLDLKQSDMMMRVGMPRQQYQRLESKGNPRLNTLELIAKGLKGELMFIPQEKLAAIEMALKSEEEHSAKKSKDRPTIADDPWQDILEDEE